MSARNRPQIKLTDFDVNARGALPRLVLAVANVKYEDERIKVKFLFDSRVKLNYLQ